MKNRKRIHYTDSQKAVMWDRWQQGEPLHRIAALFDRHASSVRGILMQHGGIRPPPKRRSPRVLSLAEREEISAGWQRDGRSRSIAASLGRAPSTVSREINRNEGLELPGQPGRSAAWDRARRPKPCKLAMHRALAAQVAQGDPAPMVPEQIAGWLRRTHR